ncbi:MAG: arginase family protein, partial [Kofleriaceae bacterium]
MPSSERVAVLVVPQWQGYAADDRPRLGALAIAAALGTATHTITVPAWHPLPVEPAGGTGVVRGLDEIVRQAASVLTWLETTRPARLLVIGGDCGSDLAPILWQSGRARAELGVLYLDAHADLNTPASSPSGRFHGMVLRTALGDGAPVLTALGPRAITAGQLVMAGTRDL